MRWPKFHTCHLTSERDPLKSREFIELTPAANAAKYDEVHQGLRICPVCSSVHPEDLYRALTENAGTLREVTPDWPSRYRVTGIAPGSTRLFYTAHLGDFGYGTDALRALCFELSKAQDRYIWEADVDGVYWKPKEESGKVGRGLLALSKKFKLNTEGTVKLDDPIDLESWRKSMESDVQKFKNGRRGR